MNIYYKTYHKSANFIIKYFVFSFILFFLITLILFSKEAKATTLYEDSFDKDLDSIKKSNETKNNSDNGIMYLIEKNKKHKILNEDVLDDYRSIIETIKLVNEKEAKNYTHANLVKTKENSNIYYINETLKKKKIIPNPEIFLAYGNKWGDVISVSQKDLESYGNIKVVKIANNPVIYELHDDFKTIISSPSKFIEAGHRWSEVVTIKQIELDYYPTRTINDENIKVAGVEYSENENINGNLSIKNIKNNQEIMAPSGTVLNLLKLELTADSGHPVFINAIEFSRTTGITSIEEIVVMDSEQNVFGRAELSNKMKLTVYFPSGIYIGSNSSKIINVKGVLDKRNTTSYERLSIKSIKSIKSNANIFDSFPITGDNFKIILADNLIGKLGVDDILVSAGLRNVSLGAKDQLITKFSLKEISDNEDIYLKRLTITQNSSKYAKIANVDLVNQNNKVLSTVAKPNGKEIVFDLSHVPYKIKQDSSQIFTIRADIISGIGNTVKMEIKNKTDIVAESKNYGFVLTPTTTGSFPIGRGDGSYFNKIKINDTDILVYKNSSSPTGDLTSGVKNQLLGVFSIKTDNIALNYKSVTLKLVNNGDTTLENDLIIRKSKTKQIIGRIPAPTNNKITTIHFDNNIKIGSNKTFAFEILGSVGKKSTVLDTYQVQISSMDFTRSDNGVEYTFNYNTNGNTLGIKINSLTITSSGKYQNLIAGKDNVLIGTFKMQAGIVEDVVVSAFNIAEVENYKIINSSEGYNNLKIKVNGKDYAIYPNPNSGSFVVNKPFTIKAGKTASIKVYIDTTPSVNEDQIRLSINNIVAYGASSKLIPRTTGDGRESSVTKFNERSRLEIEINPNINNTLIIAGRDNQKVASFIFTNIGIENIKVTNFSLVETNTSNIVSYDNGYSNFKATNTISKPLAGGTKFNGFTVKAGTTYTINVYISPNASTVGDEFNIIIKDIKVDGEIVVTGNSTVGQNISVVAAE